MGTSQRPPASAGTTDALGVWIRDSLHAEEDRALTDPIPKELLLLAGTGAAARVELRGRCLPPGEDDATA
jgi:hypothetical protein